MCKKLLHLVALEALDRQDTSCATSTKGWVLGESGPTLSVSSPLSEKRGFVYFWENKKVCYSQLQSNKPVPVW